VGGVASFNGMCNVWAPPPNNSVKRTAFRGRLLRALDHMRYVFAIVLTSVATFASASQPASGATASKVLATTKQLAAKECLPHYFGAGLRVSRCEYSPAAFIDGQWSVIVHRVLVGQDGKVVGAMGADTVYVFDKTGKYIKPIPGM